MRASLGRHGARAIAVAALATLGVRAEAVQVRLAAEPPSLQEGQSGTVRLLIVSGGRGEAQIETRRPPELPTGAGLRSQFLGQRSQFQNVNGRISQILEFDYRVTAVDVGSWQVGPVELPLDNGSKITAQPVSLVVTERVVAPGYEPEFLVEAALGDGDAYEGEVVVLHAKYRSKRVGSHVTWSLPEFEGLRPPQHGGPDEPQYTIDDPSGTIVVQELDLPLVAVATGERTQGPVIASIQIPAGGPDMFGFRRIRQEQVASDPLKLKVRPLPPPPRGFSGLIGEFEVDSTLGTAKAAVGQSIPWMVVITGDGNLDGFTLPKAEAKGASFYENSAQVTARTNGGRYLANATFRRVVVPTEPGELALPDLELITFSPQRGGYVTHKVPMGRVTVVPGREGDGTVESYGQTSVQETDPVAIDIRAIYKSGFDTALRLDRVLPAGLALAALPGLTTLGWMGGQAIARAWRERKRSQQQSSGPPTAMSALQTLTPAMEVPERLVVLDVALRRLEPYVATGQLRAERLRALRSRLGRLRFGDGSPDPTLEDDIRAMVEEVEQ